MAQETDSPQQVSVSVKILEFQNSRDLQTGFSAYFNQRDVIRPYGRVSSNKGAITSADLTFPTSTAAGLSVFLDRISIAEGDIEVVLQALEDENRASILSRPKAMVPVAALDSGVPPTQLGTIQNVPFENTVVIGNTAVQVTEFRDTGVDLTLQVPQVYDEDGDWVSTMNDSFIRLVVKASVREEGQRVSIALDDQLAAGANFQQAQNAIRVPEFVSRSIETEVWVRNGQVLVLGGLYRNTKTKSLSTVPWLSQAEDVAVGLAETAIPGNFIGSPLTATLGNREVSEDRRELVFMIKANVWRPAFSIGEEMDFEDIEDEAPEEEEAKSPADIVTGIIGTITEVPKAVGEGITGGDNRSDVERSLGGEE